jgi:hypothetical protein
MIKSGCMDLCTFNPETGKLHKAKSAKEIAKYVQGKDNTFGDTNVSDKPWLNLRYEACESPEKP